MTDIWRPARPEVLELLEQSHRTVPFVGAGMSFPCGYPNAIELAKQGKQVALVCSGDAGIYAMAALVYEIIDLEPNRISVDVIPGISAFQAAAAKAGAMIGHDFCCISLSDLLTPWEAIEKRVKAAAEAAGREFRYIPVISGQITEENVADQAAALEDLEGPVFAYCRSGARCTNLYALIQEMGE